MKTIYDHKKALRVIGGTNLKAYLNMTYNEIVSVLGEPTFNEPSGDFKTQREWVVEYEGFYFTIYDWKTYDAEFTMNELQRFNVGGRISAYNFVEEIKKLKAGK